MKRMSCTRLAALAVLLSAVALAAESRPSSRSDIAKGLDRGAALRKQAQLIPDAVQKYALVMQAGAVRCGHALVAIEDAKGETGAVYKLSEQFKAAMTGDGQSALIDYSGTFLLDADLSLLSGRMRTRSDLAGKDGKRQQLVAQATVTIRDDTLSFQMSEQREDRKEPVPKASKKLPLHGVRPMPKNTLFGLAAFAMATARDGWQPDRTDAVCVPMLDLGWEMDNFAVEPAWVSFSPPAPADPKGAAARMNVRWLVGEITERGFEVEPPEPAVWQGLQTWILDARCRPLSHPPPDDPRITVECADSATLDVNAPLDLEKIAAAMKPDEGKEHRKD